MVYIVTYGCKVNYYESEQLSSLLSAVGIDSKMISDGSISKCDRSDRPRPQSTSQSIFVVNSCAVTGMAEKKSRYGTAKIKKYHPNARIVTMGCAFGKRTPEAVAAEIAGADVPDAVVLHKREKAFIKVQDGCKNFCSFCVIPHIRNTISARPIAEVVREINAQPQKVEEIILCGINLCYYPDIAGLTAAADKCGRRFYYSSLEPAIITPEFIAALGVAKNFVPKFHICLQSGSDKVLSDMNRRYTVAEYADKITAVRTAFPTAYIATDIIVGYPTESEDDFAQTAALVKSIKFDKVHIFPYSPRVGTAAAELKPITNSVVTERIRKLQNIG